MMKTINTDNDLLVYKVTFLKNQIESCKLAEDTSRDKGNTYQEYNGQLIFALIRAENETAAKEKANEIAQKFLK